MRFQEFLNSEKEYTWTYEETLDRLECIGQDNKRYDGLIESDTKVIEGKDEFYVPICKGCWDWECSGDCTEWVFEWFLDNAKDIEKNGVNFYRRRISDYANELLENDTLLALKQNSLLEEMQEYIQRKSGIKDGVRLEFERSGFYDGAGTIYIDTEVIEYAVEYLTQLADKVNNGGLEVFYSTM